MVIKMPKWISALCKMIKSADRRLRQDNVAAYAAQAAYFILFSSIPLIMLLLNLIRYFVPGETLVVISVLVDLLPDTIGQLVNNVINELIYAGNIPLISITSLVLLWSASRGVKCIALAIRRIYNNKESRGYLYNSLVSVIYTVILIVIMALSILFLIFGKYIEDMLTNKYNIPNMLVKGLFSVRNLIILTLFTLVVMIIYKRFSGKPSSAGKHFTGAIICSSGFILYSHFFALYIDNFSDYSYVYGGLAAVVILMLWLYMCLYILLVGAVINVTLITKRTPVK